MRFGGNDAERARAPRWLRDVFGPALGRRCARAAGSSSSRSSRAGCRWATRCTSATSPARRCSCASLRLRSRAPRPTTSSSPSASASSRGNDQFFLNIAMAMGKAHDGSGARHRGSTVVTAMSRNGTDFGVRVSGLGDPWFTAPVEMPGGLVFPRLFSEDDANPDMGDSAIVETVGLGGFRDGGRTGGRRIRRRGRARDGAALTPSDGGNHGRAAIRHGRCRRSTFAGVPCGIDVRQVVETGRRACHQHRHRPPPARHRPGRRRRRAAPLACFEQAVSSPSRSRPGGVMSALSSTGCGAGFYLDSVALMRHVARARGHARASRPR